jgi:hypothetical protein
VCKLNSLHNTELEAHEYSPVILDWAIVSSISYLFRESVSLLCGFSVNLALMIAEDARFIIDIKNHLPCINSVLP